MATLLINEDAASPCAIMAADEVKLDHILAPSLRQDDGGDDTTAKSGSSQ